VFAAIAKDLATSHKVQLIYCVLACGMISNPLAPTSLMYNTFQRTGVGSLTICATLADVTLANVVHAGIATAVSPAVTATAELCTHLVAVTAPVRVEVPVTVRSHATAKSSPIVASSPTTRSSVAVRSSDVMASVVRLSTSSLSNSIPSILPSHLYTICNRLNM
jgi:hypothetical protein